MALREIVGIFRSGRLVDNRPESLPAWRVTTADPLTASKVAQLLGGTPKESEKSNHHALEILTAADSVPIIVDDPHDITTDMKLWGREGIVHHCDGIHFLSPEKYRGRPCGCPQNPTERFVHAKSGQGPQPSTDILFKLAEQRSLGIFRFHSNSWLLAKSIHEIRSTLPNAKGSIVCELSIETVETTPADGTTMRYRRPVLKAFRTGN